MTARQPAGFANSPLSPRARALLLENATGSHIYSTPHSFHLLLHINLLEKTSCGWKSKECHTKRTEGAVGCCGEELQLHQDPSPDSESSERAPVHPPRPAHSAFSAPRADRTVASCACVADVPKFTVSSYYRCKHIHCNQEKLLEKEQGFEESKCQLGLGPAEGTC